jgi:hypothetical protein
MGIRVFRKVKTVARMVKPARVSRASYYCFEENTESAADADMDPRDAIQRIVLEWPGYGRRRITHELRHRGWTVNGKRVYRLMREDNLHSRIKLDSSRRRCRCADVFNLR